MTRLHTEALSDMDVSRLKSERLRELMSYWLTQRGDAAMPSRAAIDPVEIFRLLPLVAILERLGGADGKAAGFRFRLFGTECVAKFDNDYTGMTLEEVSDHGGMADMARACEWSLAERVPVMTRFESSHRGHAGWDLERIVMPLAGKDSEMLFCGIDTGLAGPALRHVTAL